jgi:3-methylfumaryl-CoA hydratase
MNHLDRAREWLGRVDVRADVAAPSQLAALHDLIGLSEPAPEIGDDLPPLTHWLYFRSWARTSQTTQSGDFLDPSLPPIELPRRQCVENRIRFHRALRVGDPIWRFARIVDAAERIGEAGPVITLLLRHEIADAEGVAITEDKRLLYTERGEPLGANATHFTRGDPPLWSRAFRADPRTLFSYSALTCDMRRVHYDRPFATFVEGHPGLLVHPDLVATRLVGLLCDRSPGARLTSCTLHTRRWLHDTAPMLLCGRPRNDASVELWAEDARGSRALEAIATLDGGIARQLSDPGSPGFFRSATSPEA